MNPTYEDLMFALRVASACAAVAFLDGETNLLTGEDKAFFDALDDAGIERARLVTEAARKKGWQ